MSEREIPYRCPIVNICLQIQDATKRFPNPDPEYTGLAQAITEIREGPIRRRVSKCAKLSLGRNEKSCVYNRDGRRVADRISGFYSIPDSYETLPADEVDGTEVIQ